MITAVKRVPVSDPGRGVAALRDQLRDALDGVLSSGRYVHGAQHDAFERAFAAYLGVERCLGVASGTDALELALLGVGCEAGDEVVVAAHCGGYASAAARKLGLRIGLADVDSLTLNLSAGSLEPALTPATKAVVATHLYGLLAEIEAIAVLCRERGIALVEDCAQAAGARRNGRRAGAFGDAAVFSFYPTKNLAALGDGGAVVTSDGEIAERVQRLRQYGWGRKYEVTLLGGRNSRLDELHAAVLLVRLPRLDGGNAARRSIVRRYAGALAPDAGRFAAREGEDYVAHLAVLVAEEPAAVAAALDRAGIETAVHYPLPDHRQPAWCVDYPDLHLPVSEHASEHVLSLPCFPELTDGEVDRVCEVLGGLRPRPR
jgi:dTDP-4-amino-4,6-dideoxygalactose transaminase